jgi:hypothetical protein
MYGRQMEAGMDYEIITVSKYDGKGGKERAIEVFNAVTGVTVAICRRRPFETRQAWVDRAFEQAAA